MLLVSGCAVTSEKETKTEKSDTKNTNTKTEKSDTKNINTNTEQSEEKDERKEEYKDEREVWTEFSKVDYAVLAAMLHSSTNEMQACELIDIDSDEVQELVCVREIEKWSPRREVYVADVESEPYISYINDISPNGDEEICIDNGRLYFGVNYARVDSIESVLYEWNNDWKLIDEGENVIIPDGADITNDYDAVETISIPNGNYEEIVRLFQEHLDSLNLTYFVSEEDDLKGGAKTIYEVEDYAASWKSKLSEYHEREYVTFATDRKDSVAEIEIALDEEGTVNFVITLDK